MLDKILKYFVFLFLIFVAIYGIQQGAVFTFLQGYYHGCMDRSLKERMESEVSSERDRNIEKWCKTRTKNKWEYK